MAIVCLVLFLAILLSWLILPNSKKHVENGTSEIASLGDESKSQPVTTR
jgi:hypothetical protein